MTRPRDRLKGILPEDLNEYPLCIPYEWRSVFEARQPHPKPVVTCGQCQVPYVDRHAVASNTKVVDGPSDIASKVKRSSPIGCLHDDVQDGLTGCLASVDLKLETKR
jgi:hypothetical protein